MSNPVDYCSQPGLLPLKAALARMQNALVPVTKTESVGLTQALDRVLSSTIHSSIAVPGYDNSAMDGYALRYADARLDASLRLIGQSLAGHVFADELGAGECVRIMTGAAIPIGADCVAMQENTQLNGDQLTLTTLPHATENIRRAGEDIAQGAQVLPQGKRLTPVDIGLLASLGIASVNVYRVLNVAVLSTGDELTPSGQILRQGCIYDSNRYALIALLQRLNIHCIDLGLLPDDPTAISAAFAKGIAEADVVISSGGVSVGDADYTKDVLSSMGEINFWKVAIKPGKPFAFGKLAKSSGSMDHGWFFGLPGNPVSAIVTYHQLVLPALRYLAGEVFEQATSITAIANSNIKKQTGRMDFQRGILHNENGINLVSITGNQSSGMLTSIAQANCYIVLEQERGSVAKGEQVQVLMFDRFLW